MNYLKLIPVIISLTVITTGYMYINNLNNKLDEAEQEIYSLKLENSIYKEQSQSFKERLDYEQTLYKKLLDDYNRIESEKQKLLKMFSRHDFAKLVEKKPGLITLKMQKGTKRVFDEIEQLSKE